MRKLRTSPEICVACGTCESVCAKLWFKTSDVGKSSIRVHKSDDGIKITACTQCGECIAICPGVALSRDKNGVVRLDRGRCVGCLMCVGFCPELAMFHSPELTEPFKCTACGACVESCEAGALCLETAAEGAVNVG